MIGAIELREDGRRLGLALLGRLLAAPDRGSGPRRRILVVRPDHLGDLLFLTPAVRRLRRAFPGAEIVGLVGPWGRPVLERNPHLDRLITWEFPWFDRQPRHSAFGPYRSLARLARRLRAEQFDLAIQFRADFWWGALAARLGGIPERVGYDVPSVRPFLTSATPLCHGLHAADENLRLVAALDGGPAEPGRLEFPITPAERRRAHDLIGPGPGERPRIAIQVGAGAPVKLWPRERLAEAGRALAERFGAHVVVLGGPTEAEAVGVVAAGIGAAAIGLAGVTTVGELAAVLERCDLALGPDSGPLHLAVAVGTPTLHLFGPADPRRFGPYGDPRRHRVLAAHRPCVPCNRLTFPEADLPRHDCLATIGIDEVVAAASDLLRESKRRER
jgi:heptosyltransferase-2/heptosyltransferase-3